MINHYFFLRQLGFQLDSVLNGAKVEAIYSTSLQELHLSFSKGPHKMLLRLNWETDYSLIHWSQREVLYQPKYYEKQLFDAWGKDIVNVHPVLLERLICLELENGSAIWLKLFGKMGNAILLSDGEVVSVFRRSRQKDFDFQVADFSFDQSTHRWSDLCLREAVKTKQVLKNLKWPAFETLSPAGQNAWFMLPSMSLNVADVPMLEGTLSKPAVAVDYLELASSFWQAYLPQWVLSHTKDRLLKELSTAHEKLKQRLSEAKERIEKLHQNISYEQIGHLIMSHAHAIQAQTAQVEIPSFDNPNQFISIKLNPNLSAYENASRYYQKSKNQHIELSKLTSYINSLGIESDTLSMRISALQAVENMRELNKLLKKSTQTDEVNKPWKKMSLGAFEVWIGKNATGNDELLRNVHKDDLWLHARKVNGSHVIIRSAGKSIPKDVLEQAASWAAWFSKGKNESLCPVIYTPRKYVRKRKGSAAGSVLVEKEEVIIVPPMKPNIPND